MVTLTWLICMTVGDIWVKVSPEEAKERRRSEVFVPQLSMIWHCYSHPSLSSPGQLIITARANKATFVMGRQRESTRLILFFWLFFISFTLFINSLNQVELWAGQAKHSQDETTKQINRLSHVQTYIYRARIFKRLWSPGIDSKEWIPPAYVAWRAGTITLFLLSS